MTSVLLQRYQQYSKTVNVIIRSFKLAARAELLWTGQNRGNTEATDTNYRWGWVQRKYDDDDDDDDELMMMMTMTVYSLITFNITLNLLTAYLLMANKDYQ